MIVVAELPGVEREALKMAGQGRTLTISGERRREWYPTRKSSPKKNNKSKESKKPVRDVQHSVLQDDLDVLFGYARHVGRSMSSFLHMSTSGTK